MTVKFFKDNPEPYGIYLRILLNIFPYSLQGKPFPRGYFLRVNLRRSITTAYKNMIILMLGKTIIKRSLIDKGEDFLKGDFHTHFLLQASLSSGYIGLPCSGMTATGISPKVGRMVFTGCTLLQKHFFFRIEDKNRNKKWDTGNFLLKKQPENICYFAKEIELRANWEVEQDISFAKQAEEKPKQPKEKSVKE